MKKFLLTLIFATFALSYTSSFAADSCDQIFYGTLRHGKQYEFYDSFYNYQYNQVGIESVQVDYREEYDYNGSSLFPTFAWNQNFINMGYILNYGQQSEVITATSSYPVIYHPATRSYNNFFIKYTGKYYTSNDGVNFEGPKYHTECKYYDISWCGDGVLDTQYETCDPNDPSKTGHGNGGCSTTTCTPITVETPSTCEGLSISTDSTLAPAKSTLTCTGNKVNSFKITCGNGTVLTAPGTGVGIESKTFSIPNGCNYPTSGTYNVTCTVNDSISSDACKKTVVLNARTPAISIDKRDANPLPADKDGIVGNDTQTVDTAAKAVFKITVTNTGTEPLKSITLTDPVEPSCAGVVTLPNTKPATWSSYAFVGNNDDVFDPGETFSYTCEKINTTQNYTNTAAVSGIGVYSNTLVSDDDPTQVRVLQPYYDLALTKVIKTPQASYKRGDTVTYTISVTNQGTINANTVEVTDYIPTGLSLVPSSTWSVVSGNQVKTSVGPLLVGQTKTVDITLKIDVVTGKLINWAEISLDDGDDIDSTPDTNNDNDCHGGKPRTEVDPSSDNRTDGVGDTNKNGSCEPGEDEDDHDPAEINVGTEPAIEVVKTDANADDLDKNIGNDVQTVVVGSKAVWKIRVTNVGPEALKDLKLTDPQAPNCAGSVTLPSTFPSTFSSITKGGSGDYNDAILSPGEYFDYVCEKTNTTSNYTNLVAVEGTGVTSNKKVTDDDPSDVKIPGSDTPIINIDKRDANPNDRDGLISTNDDQLINRGDKAIFKIRVTNTGGESLTSIVLTDINSPSCAGNVVLPNTFPTTWSNIVKGGSGDLTNATLEPGEYFEYTCEQTGVQNNFTNTAKVTAVGVNSGKPTEDDDPTGVRVDGGGSSSSSSSSSSGGPSCTRISVVNKSSTGGTLSAQVTCYGSQNSTSMGVLCGDGSPKITGVGVYDNVSNLNKFTTTCEYSSSVKVIPQIQCFVGKGRDEPFITNSACRTNVTLGGSTYCGDGVVQRPNSDGQMEQCEKVVSKDTGKLVFPSFCNSQCKIDFTTKPGICPNTNGGCLLTTPDGGDLVINPAGSLIVGNNVNPFNAFGVLPSIQNNSSQDLYLDELCVMRKTGSSVTGNTQCTPINVLYPGQKVTFGTFPNFTSNTSLIPSGQTYQDNKLVTTIKNDGQMYDWAYFTQPLNVRVAKSTVVTTGGGTNVLKNTNNVSNVETLATNTTTFQVDTIKSNENKNFAGTSVSNLSSYSKDDLSTTTKDTVVNSVDVTKTTEKLSTSTVNALNDITTLGTLENTSYKYNGLDNVYIVKGQDVKIGTTSIPSYLTGPRTYIIEDANLIIDADINYPDNIAFVVKGGTIYIGNAVKNISGIYIAIPKGTVGGDIMGSTTEDTQNILTVNGSLYGKITNLLSKRTYVRDNSSGQIDVGTIVSFASGLFRKPAPLVSEFIDEYTKTSKIAK